MIRALVIAGSLLTLAACAGGDGPTGRAWYENGDASYDSLKAATDACKAKGGDFRLRDGGDPTHLGDFSCVMSKGH